MKILVVDGDPDIREMLGLLLPMLFPGVTMATAGSAAEALIRLDRTVDLLLLADELGPGEDGPELLAGIREYAPPVVGMVTDWPAEVRFRRLGVTTIWRPFECYQLRTAIDRALAPEPVRVAT